MQLEEFLKQQKYFSLGHLPTEGFHPSTEKLSDEVARDLPRAIGIVQKIDLEAIALIKKEIPVIDALRIDIQQTLQAGKRIFLSGCGATGRLALTLETTWRKVQVGNPRENSVQVLMAGGDFALVKSVENFEDFPEYGERHLRDLGFSEGDLLIAVTEGGETPYVIGTLHGALKTSKKNHWFVYCNPRELLCKTVERSRQVIENPRVNSLCLPIGPMALSGSTRLQAASVQMFSVGSALLCQTEAEITGLLDQFLKGYAMLDLAPFLTPLIEWEAQCYQRNETVLYQTTSYPIAVLTDTTERSPTFSLTPFEKSTETKGPVSLCYLSIPGAKTAMESWRLILNRTPIGLEWSELMGRLGLHSILEFDFGRDAVETRAKRVAPQKQNLISLEGNHAQNAIDARAGEFSASLHTRLIAHPLLEQILIKLLLNTLSLMVMGKLHRYEGNVMTWVRASNGKLIDRTLRYLEFLISRRGHKAVPREELLKEIFLLQPILKPDEAMILKILEDLNET